MKYHDRMQILGEKFKETKDHKDFNKLYDFSYSYYRGVAYRYYLQDNHSVKDILNSFYANIFQFIDQYDQNKGSFTAWIGAIFTNEVRDYFNKRKIKKLFYFEKFFDDVMPIYEQEYNLIHKENKEELFIEMENSIKKILKPFQTILKDKYYNYLTEKEISKKYNIPVQTVKNGLFKARNNLREIMKDNNFKYKRGLTNNNVLKLALERYNKLMDLSKEDLIKIIYEMEDQIKILNQ